MRAILCNITAERQETISQVVSPSVFKLSVANSTTIPVGSIITNTNNNKATQVKSIFDNGDIEVFDATYSPNAGDTIVISSIFRYSNLETTIDHQGNTLVYQGRLNVGSINESFGSFVNKKQVISNANISILNLDGKLSDIFHSYKLHTGASVELLYGDTNNYSDFKRYFYGITASGSNFTYDDSVFSFSVKDFRSTMLDSLVPPTVFDPNLFSKYRAFNVSSTVAYINIDPTLGVPSDWYVGLQIKTLTGTATITEINGLVIGITSYSNVISSGQNLDSIFLASTTKVSSTLPAVVPVDQSVSILGDTGHFIGIADDTSITTADFITPDTKTQISTTSVDHIYGSLYIPYPKDTGIIKTLPTISGIINSIDIKLIYVVHNLRIEATLTVNNTVYKKTFDDNGGFADGTPDPRIITLDFSSNNIKVKAQDTVTLSFSIISQLGQGQVINVPSSTFYDVDVYGAVLSFAKRRSIGGTVTTTHTIDLNTEGVTASPSNIGNIYFTRSPSKDISGANNCKISAELINTAGASQVFNDIINSGLQVPTEISGLPVSTIKFYITLNPSKNLVDPVELYSLFVSYNTNVISGATSDMGNKPIPLLYGDFSDTAVPAILIHTVVDRTFGVNYTLALNGTSTNSLLYTKIVSGSTKVMQVGDSIRYTSAGTTSEEIYAKITQIVPDANPDTGKVYFEDFNILPDIGKPTTIEREVNTYKVCDNPITNIVEYLYLPSKGTILLPLPGSISTSENLASGEFTLTGSNLADKIYVKCTGKSDSNGVLIESPEAIINELSSLIGFPISTKVISTNSVKLRRYIDTEVKFSEFLASIEASSNIYTYMSVDNILNINRFAATNVYSRTYNEHNLIQDSFQESYDPDNVYTDGSIMSYNYSPFDKANIKSTSLGSSATTNLIESAWLWRDADAELINRQLFNITNKLPELIQVTIAADDILDIKLGENLRIIHNNAEHIIFVYTYSKNTKANTIDIIGWNLANGYNIDFPIPEFAEFPTALQKGPYGYTPWLLNDKTVSNVLGNYDANSITSEGFRVSSIGSVVTTNPPGINYVSANNSVLIVKPSIGATLDISMITVLVGSATIGLSVGLCSEAELQNITGNAVTDIYTSILTLPLGTLTTTLPVTTAANPYILLYFNDGTTIYGLELYYPIDNNIADDRYNYWNPNWGYEQKLYYLARHKIQGLPPSGLCVARDGSIIDNIEAFKGK